ncbi:hypothetical protein NM208_g11640 [Fusarium decemcellulare]|uniref:Uncharacterized protein n=1 Tax=Fusarium decemcellulare TaxID=57161 RepID=A0ACC1RTP3_9HYPO|nr:hypothetical protein NM208_g11640 [Fusarium decemcellulare]
MDAELSQEIAKSKLTPCIFNNQVKLGSGDQINCHDIGFEGDVKGVVPPDTSGDRWNGGGIFPYPSGTEPVGKQINGVVIRRIKRDQDGEKSG